MMLKSLDIMQLWCTLMFLKEGGLSYDFRQQITACFLKPWFTPSIRENDQRFQPLLCMDIHFYMPFLPCQRAWWNGIAIWAPWRRRTLVSSTESWCIRPRLARMSLSWCRKNQRRHPVPLHSRSLKPLSRPPLGQIPPPHTNLSHEPTSQLSGSDAWQFLRTWMSLDWSVSYVLSGFFLALNQHSAVSTHRHHVQ